VTLFFTNLYDCARVVALAGEDGNQNFAGTAVILRPMDAPYQGAEVISCRAGEEEYGRCRRVEAVGIYGDRRAEVNVGVTSVTAGNRRFHICRRKGEQWDVMVVEAAASAVVTTTGRLEVVDVD